MFDLPDRSRRIPLQRSGHRHHHPRRTKSALQRILLNKSSLHRMHPHWRPKPLNRRNLMPARINGQDHARSNRPSIKMHRASTARASIANQLGSSQPQVLP
jgi:hypothetical protein